MLPCTPPNSPSRSSWCLALLLMLLALLYLHTDPHPTATSPPKHCTLERAHAPLPPLAPSSTPHTPYKVSPTCSLCGCTVESLYVPCAHHNHPLTPLTLSSNCFSSPNPFCYSNVCNYSAP